MIDDPTKTPFHFKTFALPDPPPDDPPDEDDDDDDK
jgi:hypothetical protein